MPLKLLNHVNGAQVFLTTWKSEYLWRKYKKNLSLLFWISGLAKRVGAKILFASTSEVYGDPEVHPQPETYWGHVNPIGDSSYLTYLIVYSYSLEKRASMGSP
jgi:UDP-glucose 4-epimerase